MCSISVQSIMQDKSYPEAGNALYCMIVSRLDEDSIVLDLSGIVSLPSMFLNTSIGKFINVYGVELLRKKISFANITATQAARIKEYINKITE